MTFKSWFFAFRSLLDKHDFFKLKTQKPLFAFTVMYYCNILSENTHLVKKIDIKSFFELSKELPLFDVRTPAEFSQGHIPQAHNLALFSNEERAVVGTIYKQDSPKAAMLKGLEFVGPKMRPLIEEVATKISSKSLAVHCWRGGKRSSSVGWLLGMGGFEVSTITGGYKAYRTHVLQQFHDLDLKLIVLGGKTGAGKTKILRALAEKGEQVVDLEALAHHKGSAFGFIGEATSPTVEQFENNLFAALNQLDFSKRIWVENESRRIGKVLIPQGFWNQMRQATLINIELPFDIRLAVSLENYTTKDTSQLQKAFYNIRKRLGGQNLQSAMSYLDEGNLSAAASIALKYYDKQYQYMLEKNDAPNIKYLAFEQNEPKKTADYLMNYVNQNKL